MIDRLNELSAKCRTREYSVAMAEAAEEIARLSDPNKLAAEIVKTQRLAVSLGEHCREAWDANAKLRETLAIVQNFIEDGSTVNDPNNPTLLQLIDRALGHEQ